MNGTSSSRPVRHRRPAVVILACGLVAALLALPVRGAVRRPHPAPARPIAGVEQSGTALGLVVPGHGAAVAGVARCPAPSRDGISTAALFLAAEALARELGAGDGTSFADVGGGVLPGAWIVAGSLVPGEVPGVARRLADPPRPREESVAAARQVALARARSFATDPLLRARAAAWARLFPGAPDPWSGWGREEEITAIPSSLVRELAGALAADRIVVAGPAGLAGRVTAVARNRQCPGVPAGRLPARVLVERNSGEEVAIVLAWRGDPAGPPWRPDGRRTAELLVLAEALREGEGSLAQRVGVAAGEDALVRSDVVLERGPGGPMLRLELVVRPRVARRALAILEGTVASVKELQLRRDAILRARGRLDARAAALAGNPLAVLRDAVRGSLLAWPPADRWRRPVSPGDVLARARAFLRPDRRVLALAGPVDPGLVAALEADETSGPLLRVPWEDFDPARPGMIRESPVLARARSLLARLAPAGVPGDGESFRALYEVEVATPLGPGRHRLLVSRSPDGISVRAEGDGWAVEGEEDDAGAEAWVSRERASEAGPLPVPPGTVDLLAWIEPVFLAQGLVSGRLSPASCADGEVCAVLPGGRRIVLHLDGNGMPAVARVYAPGSGTQPFRTVEYLGFRAVEGVRLAAEVSCRPRDGMEEHRRLLTFSFGEAAPAATGNSPAGGNAEKELSGEREGLE